MARINAVQMARMMSQSTSFEAKAKRNRAGEKESMQLGSQATNASNIRKIGAQMQTGGVGLSEEVKVSAAEKLKSNLIKSKGHDEAEDKYASIRDKYKDVINDTQEAFDYADSNQRSDVTSAELTTYKSQIDDIKALIAADSDLASNEKVQAAEDKMDSAIASIDDALGASGSIDTTALYNDLLTAKSDLEDIRDDITSSEDVMQDLKNDIQATIDELDGISPGGDNTDELLAVYSKIVSSIDIAKDLQKGNSPYKNEAKTAQKDLQAVEANLETYHDSLGSNQKNLMKSVRKDMKSALRLMQRAQDMAIRDAIQKQKLAQMEVKQATELPEGGPSAAPDVQGAEGESIQAQTASLVKGQQGDNGDQFTNNLKITEDGKVIQVNPDGSDPFMAQMENGQLNGR